MKNPFKKSQKTKEQRTHEKRVNQFVKERFYPTVISQAKNVNEITYLVKAVKVALEEELTKRVVIFKREMEELLFRELNLKALPGKHEKEEQVIIESLANETLKTADFIITRWPMIIEDRIRQEMQDREPESLKVEFDV